MPPPATKVWKHAAWRRQTCRWWSRSAGTRMAPTPPTHRLREEALLFHGARPTTGDALTCGRRGPISLQPWPPTAPQTRRRVAQTPSPARRWPHHRHPRTESIALPLNCLTHLLKIPKQVAGAAALMRGLFAEWPARRVADELIGAAVPRSGLIRWSSGSSGRALDAGQQQWEQASTHPPR